VGERNEERAGIENTEEKEKKGVVVGAHKITILACLLSSM